MPTPKTACDAQIPFRGPHLRCAKEYAQRKRICASKTNTSPAALREA